MPLRLILICFLVYFFATTVQRVSGFGMGIVAMMILPYLIGSHAQTAAYTNILSAISSAAMAWRYRRLVRADLIVPILAGSFPVTIIAVRFLGTASFAILEKLLGAILFILSIYFMFLKGRIRIRPLRRNGFLAGCCGGALNGLFSAGGPPVVMYLLGTTDRHEVYFATIQAYFMVNNTYAVLVRLLNGQIPPAILPGLIGAIPAMICGVLAGGRLVRYIPEAAFLKIIYTVMAVSGITMLL